MNSRSPSERTLAPRGGARKERPRSGPREPRLRQRFREETRRAILAAAESALVGHGLHGARMETIAKSAGVAVGTVYNYFADREELVSALLDLRRKEILEALDTLPSAGVRSDFRAQLERYVRTTFEQLESHRALFRLLLQEDLGIAKPHNKQTMLRELMLRLDRLMAIGVAEGTLRREGAELFGALLLGMMRGVLLHSLSGPSGKPLSESVAPVLHLFLHGGSREP